MDISNVVAVLNRTKANLLEGMDSYPPRSSSLPYRVQTTSKKYAKLYRLTELPPATKFTKRRIVLTLLIMGNFGDEK
ncbi:hypothetical protein NC651_037714 [Populus alba x Populus x berolinensis]|nr:hypothetical protein NC651_037714 [Populus alba x Populus x berolinensis]